MDSHAGIGHPESIYPLFTERRSYFYHPNSVVPFMKRLPVDKRHLFGQEGFPTPNKFDIITRSRDEVDRRLELAKRYIDLPEMLNWPEHARYIGPKR